MKGIKEIRGRIRAVDNVAKITSAMQLVASSKMKRAQDSAINSRPYLNCLADVVARLSEQPKRNKFHPFFIEREVKHRCIVVVSTDRGLCGVLNNNLFKNIERDPDACYISIGRKAMQYLSRGKFNLVASFLISDRVQYHELSGFCECIEKLYVNGEIDTVEIMYQQFINTLRYVPRTQQVLPMSTFWENFEQVGEDKNDPRPVLYEPNREAVIDYLARIFLKYSVHQILLEAKASEHSARMVAMKNATDNAEELSQELKLDYNKVRQYAITNEIIELAASASTQG